MVSDWQTENKTEMWKLMNDATTYWCVLHSGVINQCKKYQFVVFLASTFKFNLSVTPAGTVPCIYSAHGKISLLYIAVIAIPHSP